VVVITLDGIMRGNFNYKKHVIEPDEKFGSLLVAKLINNIMLNGKKTVAKKIVYTAFEESSKELKVEPMDLFESVIKNVGPIMEVKGKRIGGANYQVPVEVNKSRKNTLALRWIIQAARSRSGMTMGEALKTEFVEAYNNTGAAVKKREETHRMAEANKAFAHFARL
jgi:small subunit ribosomal protein S7